MGGATTAHGAIEGVGVAKDKDLLVELVTPVLQPGEELISTVKVTYNGSVLSNVLSMNASVGAIDEDHEPAALDPDAAFAFPTANQMALALTGWRIFAWSLGITGKPKQFVGEVPLGAIVAVEADPRHPAMVRVHMKSSNIVDLEFMRGEPYPEFLDELQSLLGATAVPERGAEVVAESESPAESGPTTGPEA